MYIFIYFHHTQIKKGHKPTLYKLAKCVAIYKNLSKWVATYTVAFSSDFDETWHKRCFCKYLSQIRKWAIFVHPKCPF